MRSQRAVVLSFMITAGSGLLAFYLPTKYRKQTLWGLTKADGDFPPVKFFLGIGITFFGISAVSEFSPEIAGPFAVLVMTTAGLFNGVPAIEYLIGSGNDSKLPPAKPGTPVLATTPGSVKIPGGQTINVRVPVVNNQTPTE